MLKRALSAFRGDDLSNDEALRWLWLACVTAIHLWDEESWRVLSDRYVQLARDAGALTVLPLALNHSRRVSRVCAASSPPRRRSEKRRERLASRSEIRTCRISSLFLAGWRGREPEAVRLIEASDRDAAGRGEGRRIGAGRYATAVLYNGLGRYERALAAAEQALEYPRELATSRWALSEQIEAATRSGKPEPAAAPSRDSQRPRVPAGPIGRSGSRPARAR